MTTTEHPIVRLPIGQRLAFQCEHTTGEQPAVLHLATNGPCPVLSRSGGAFLTPAEAFAMTTRYADTYALCEVCC